MLSRTHENRRKPNPLLNAVSNYAGRFSAMAAWFILAPFIVRELGDSRYGLWVLVGSITSYGSLLEFGIGDSVTKYVAEYWSKEKFDLGRRLVAAALTLYLIIGLTIVLLGSIAAPIFPLIFRLPEEDAQIGSWLILLLSLRLALSIPFSAAPAVIKGLQRFDLFNIVNIFGTLFSTAAIAITLWLDGGVIGLAVVNIATALATQIPLVWIVYRLAPTIRLGTLSLDKTMFGQVYRYSWSLLLLRIGGRLENSTDEIVISLFAAIASVTPYSLALKLSTMPQIVAEQFIILLLPMASEREAANDEAGLRSLFLTGSRLALAAFLPIGVNLIFFAAPLLTLWVGANYAEYAYLVTILVTASLFDILLWPAGQVLQGIAKHSFPAVMSFLTGIANLLFSIFLVSRIGLIGVALGTLLATIFVAFTIILFYTLKVLSITGEQYWRKVIWPSLLPALPLAAMALLFTQISLTDNWITLGIKIGLSSFFYVFIYVNMKAARAERAFIVDWLKNAQQHLERRRSE